MPLPSLEKENAVMLKKPFWSRVCRLAALGLTLVAVSTYAQVPQDMTYTGRLVDGAGSPLAGPVDLDLRIFDAEFGGTQLYSEEHLGVALDATGGFSVQLGLGANPSGTFDADLFSDVDRWLEVVADGEVLTPRQIIASVPWALIGERALVAESANKIVPDPSDPYKPIWFKKYSYSTVVSGADLDVDYRDYAAAIVGFNSGYYDVDENNAKNHMRVYLEKNTTTFKWKLYAYDEGDSGDWPQFTVWVMYIDMDLVGDMVNY
jgi:hypothetical protein